MLKNKKIIYLNLAFIIYACCSFFFFILFKEGDWKFSGYEGLPIGMIWNLFLAYISYNLVFLLMRLKNKYGQIICFFLAFLFYPNSFYMITDAKHIGDWFPNPRTFNFIGTKETIYYMLLMSAVFLGVLIAVETMLLFLKVFLHKKIYRLIFIIVTSFLSSVAIYAGRVDNELLRLNSWDLILRPFYTIESLFRIISPEHFVFLLAFTLFQVFMITLGFIFSMKDEEGERG
ncbi:MAG: DUF1361 domain-containing protein [Lactovum sp.]